MADGPSAPGGWDARFDAVQPVMYALVTAVLDSLVSDRANGGLGDVALALLESCDDLEGLVGVFAGWVAGTVADEADERGVDPLIWWQQTIERETT